MQRNDSITPRGPYQECLEHALTLSHILELATLFMPKDSELWDRAGVELSTFSRWINHAIDADSTRLEARRHRGAAKAEAA
jgi:hypothetical protein